MSAASSTPPPAPSPLKVWGVSVSYYTGKLEAYLRYKGIPYSMESPFAHAKRIVPLAGAMQVPMIECADGRFMSDTTPILRYLEQEHAHAPILPEDPVVAFIALLMEDYADEWLWRPAMHYRWSYDHDSALLSRILADEVANHLPAPRFLKLRRIYKRQLTSFVKNDGVTPNTVAHVEQGYLNALQHLSALLQERPYLLGSVPCIADFGFMGPMLRHFGQDPTPAEIMRNQAPAVYEWVARMWNARGDRISGEMITTIDEAYQPLLQEIAQTHLLQLSGNAEAYAAGKTHFDMTCQNTPYQNLPVSRYRVHCLEMLRDHFFKLPTEAQNQVKTLLPWPEAQVLWQSNPIASSHYDEEGLAPFNKAINVYGKGVPPKA